VEYESAGQGRTELPEELKSKIRKIQTRFTGKEERAAFKFLINYFLLKGFSQPRKLVLDTLRRQFNLSLEKAASLMITRWLACEASFTNITARFIRLGKWCGSVSAQRF
jgi:hypothetical protein